MTEDSSDKQGCPGCKQYSRQEQLEAVGMVLTATEAMVNNDLCDMFGLEPQAYLAHVRESVNAELAQTL